MKFFIRLQQGIRNVKSLCFHLIVALITTHLLIALGQAQSRKIYGHVLKSDGHPLPYVRVGLHHYASNTTSSQGDFDLDIPTTVPNGTPVIFYVESPWIVVDPIFNGVQGQVPLPAPGVEVRISVGIFDLGSLPAPPNLSAKPKKSK